MPRQVTSIAIPAVLDISEGVLGRLDEILRKHQFDKAIMFFDDFSYQQYEHSLKTAFQHVKVEAVLLPSNLDIQELLKRAFSIGNCDVIIAMGGGYVVDCGKYIAFSKRTPFISIPTSAS
ncbi:glycerol dehydrogenase, partial [Bacillus licheniformis]